MRTGPGRRDDWAVRQLGDDDWTPAMTESRWKLSMDGHGATTITGDGFRLTTTGSAPLQMAAIVAELQALTRYTYGQYCGLSRALEMVGERWSMLLVRNLIVGPRSLAELHEGFRELPADLLETRLRELERSGVAEPRPQPDPDGVQRYQLTEYGRRLEDIVLAFGRWGSAKLAEPRPEDVITDESMITGLRAIFQPEAARGVRLGFELRLGVVLLHARVDDGKLEVDRGPLPDADLVIETGMMLKDLMSGDVTPDEALASDCFTVYGDTDLLPVFASLFRVPRLPGVR